MPLVAPPRLRAIGLAAAVTAALIVALAAVFLIGSVGSRPDPSGVPMPGSLPGWRRVFADDFAGRRIDPATWSVYSGRPRGDAAGWFAPSHVTAAGGQLLIAGYRDPQRHNQWVTGGISSGRAFSQVYGKYLVRMRMDPGVGITHAILLWPADNSWPPEIDFSEDNGSNRGQIYATLHYRPGNLQVQRTMRIDLTHWHTVGVEWAPGGLRYTVDGRVWATVPSAHVPSIPMVMDIQTQAWACGQQWEHCPGASTPSRVRLHVDWAVAYGLSRR